MKVNLSKWWEVAKELFSRTPQFPPVPRCLICTRQNHWIEPGKTYGCGFHTFTVRK